MAADSAWSDRLPTSNKKETQMNVRTVLSFILVAAVALTIAGSVEAAQPAGVVNVNTASAEQLQLLPRVGPALAGRIIDFREANGPFRTVDEIVAVKGIGETSLEKLEPYIVTSGATTLAENVKSPRSSDGSSKAAD
jgi:competence protein ComEA